MASWRTCSLRARRLASRAHSASTPAARSAHLAGPATTMEKTALATPSGTSGGASKGWGVASARSTNSLGAHLIPNCSPLPSPPSGAAVRSAPAGASTPVGSVPGGTWCWAAAWASQKGWAAMARSSGTPG
eukprot:15447074-Alexandrium_andersonii.AAC.1